MAEKKGDVMNKVKLIVILTETGLLDCRIVSTNASSDDIEGMLSETYSLGSIQWMETNKVTSGALQILDAFFGNVNK